MLTRTKIAASFGTLSLMFAMLGARDANAGSKLPDPVNAGVAGRLYRLDCGHSLANDESVWTPGENIGRDIEFSVHMLGDKARKRLVVVGYGCSGDHPQRSSRLVHIAQIDWPITSTNQ